MRPFSHVLGDTCLIPGSCSMVQAYPTRMRLTSLDAPHQRVDFTIKLTGPFKGFTLMQDLEKGCVRVYGTAQEGFCSFRLSVERGSVTLTLERCPEGGVVFVFETGEQRLVRKQQFSFSALPPCLAIPPLDEQVHFGCHKKQDWTLVKRRLSLDEILPLWFALGRYYPHISPHFSGTAELFKQCQRVIDRRDRVQIGPLLLILFQVGFWGILTPRLFDTDFQGIMQGVASVEGSPLMLLGYGAILIRSLFCHLTGYELTILPCLPVELHAGSFQNIVCSEGMTVDIKWSKKILRHLTIHSYCNQTVCLKLQKQIKSFRLGNMRLSKDVELDLEAGKTYFFDRFEK